jgi:hypothetical protein
MKNLTRLFWLCFLSVCISPSIANTGKSTIQHESGEHLSFSFLVVEVTGKKDPQGHKFDIDCHGEKCKIHRITLSESIRRWSEGNFLSGKHVELSSEDRSLGVERLQARAAGYRSITCRSGSSNFRVCYDRSWPIV